MKDLRCPEGRKFGELDSGVLEFKCRDPRCQSDGVVVIHRFAADTGDLLETLRYKEPSEGGM